MFLKPGKIMKKKLMMLFMSLLMLGTNANAGIFDSIRSLWNQSPLTLQQQRRVALTLALHPRLGENSPAHGIAERVTKNYFRIC